MLDRSTSFASRFWMFKIRIKESYQQKSNPNPQEFDLSIKLSKLKIWRIILVWTRPILSKSDIFWDLIWDWPDVDNRSQLCLRQRWTKSFSEILIKSTRLVCRIQMRCYLLWNRYFFHWIQKFQYLNIN